MLRGGDLASIATTALLQAMGARGYIGETVEEVATRQVSHIPIDYVFALAHLPQRTLLTLGLTGGTRLLYVHARQLQTRDSSCQHILVFILLLPTSPRFPTLLRPRGRIPRLSTC
jgi:hypothetical protein